MRGGSTAGGSSVAFASGRPSADCFARDCRKVSLRMADLAGLEERQEPPREAFKRNPPRFHTLRSNAPNTISLRALMAGTAVLGAAVFGWIMRGRLGLDPGSGMGYWLGIAGLAMMILLLGYPLRKRYGPRIPGSVGRWFRLHMMLGLLGPLAILYHADFTWRSLNSGVALWAMILVASSGLVGRYIHAHLYRGHSLRHRHADEIMRELRRQRGRLDRDGALGQKVEARLAHFQAMASHPRRRLSRAVAASIRLWSAIMLERHGLVHRSAVEVMDHMAALGASRPEQLAAGEAVRQHLRDYMNALIDAGTFSTFERLFALWHLAHIPLYLFLGITATIHVLAAHYY